MIDEAAIKNLILQEDNDYKLPFDMFDIPKEARMLENLKIYKFRWIEADVSRVKFMTKQDRPLRWWLCNKRNCPSLEPYFDDSIGGVRRHGQILVFKPWEDWEFEKNMRK